MENNELQRGLSASDANDCTWGTIGVGLFMGQQVQSNGLAHQLFYLIAGIFFLIMRAMGK